MFGGERKIRYCEINDSLIRDEVDAGVGRWLLLRAVIYGLYFVLRYHHLNSRCSKKDTYS